jgi:hypothetical protein
MSKELNSIDLSDDPNLSKDVSIDEAITEESTPDPEYDDFQDDDNQSEPTIPQELRKLRTQAYDKSISDLITMIQTGDIILDPDYQRNYVWDNKKASLLIESILLNVPIPVIYIAEDEELRWLVVDGLQRLHSLRRFYDNEFRLGGLEVLKELNKLQYSKLNPKAQRIFKTGMIRIIVIKEESHPDIKYDIFLRLNRGSIKLNEQELRNCLYRGTFNKFLKKIRENESFLKLLGLPKPHKRFFETELTLRFFAFYENYSEKDEKVIGYPNKMKTFLNNYFDKKKNIDNKALNHLEKVFTETIEKVTYVFGVNAFRRINNDGTFDSRINRALMDSVMISFSKFDLEQIKKRKNKIIEMFKKLLSDADFNDAITIGTSDTKKVDLRINKAVRSLRTVIQE